MATRSQFDHGEELVQSEIISTTYVLFQKCKSMSAEMITNHLKNREQKMNKRNSFKRKLKKKKRADWTWKK